MAINYTKNDWVHGKVFDPDTMNGIEQGIKSACDGVDRLDGIVATEQELLDLKYLGYTVPKEMPVQNQKTSDGYVVNGGRVDLGGLSWNKTTYNGVVIFYATFASGCNGTLNSAVTNAYCSAYTSVSRNQIYSGTNGIACESGAIYVHNNSYTDETAFKTSLTGKYLYYPLANPYTLPLDGAEVSNDTNDLKFLGWTVPREMPVKNYVDSDGKFHQRVGRVDLSSLSWSKSEATGAMYATVPAYPFKANVTAYCSKYTFGGTSESTSGVANGTFALYYSSGAQRPSYEIYVKDTSYTDASTFKTAMSGVYLYYELATEVVISEGEEVSSTAVVNFTPVIPMSQVYAEKKGDVVHFSFVLNSSDSIANAQTIAVGLPSSSGYFAFNVFDYASGKLVNGSVWAKPSLTELKYHGETLPSGRYIVSGFYKVK